MGPRARQKLFTLQTLPARAQHQEDPSGAARRGAARAGGFSLHAAMEVGAHEREKLEQLCRL